MQKATDSQDKKFSFELFRLQFNVRTIPTHTKKSFMARFSSKLFFFFFTCPTIFSFLFFLFASLSLSLARNVLWGDVNAKDSRTRRLWICIIHCAERQIPPQVAAFTERKSRKHVARASLFLSQSKKVISFKTTNSAEIYIRRHGRVLGFHYGEFFLLLSSDWRMMEVRTLRGRSSSTGPCHGAYQRQYLFHPTFPWHLPPMEKHWYK